MRHKKLILFLFVLVAGTVALIRLSANDPSVRGQDPNIETRGTNTAGAPMVGTSGSTDPAAGSSTGHDGRTGPAVQANTTWRGDGGWLQEAAALNAKEVALADLAQRRANGMDVKRYAAELNREHAAANEELRKLAASKKWAFTESMDALQEQTLAALDRAQGPEFDRAFIEAMIQSHERAIASFQAAVSAASDPDLRAWTGRHLPALQQHLEHARSLKR